jgi:hypothetical protein
LILLRQPLLGYSCSRFLDVYDFSDYPVVPEKPSLFSSLTKIIATIYVNLSVAMLWEILPLA